MTNEPSPQNSVPPESKPLSEPKSEALGFLNLTKPSSQKNSSQEELGLKYQELDILDDLEAKSRGNFKQTSRLERQKVGTLLDDYRTTRQIKENSWSMTYLATHEKTKESYFLRTLKSSVLQVPGAVEEIEFALMGMQSWKRSDLLIFGALHRTNFAVYSLAPYEEMCLLKDIPEKRLNPQQALKVLLKIIDALLFLREHAILHRNLSPESIFVDAQYQKIWLDELELSYLLERRIQENNWIRNPDFLEINTAYQSLEVISGQLVDPRSDIYSLGLILFELLSNEYAFEASSPEQKKLRQMTNTLGDLKKIVPLCPENVYQLVLKCTAGNPQDRFQTLEDLQNAIHQIRQEWVAPPKTSSGQTKRLSPRPKDPESSFTFKASSSSSGSPKKYIYGAVLLLLILLGYFWTHHEVFHDSDQLWVQEEIVRCAGKIQEVVENESEIRVLLEDFENVLRPLVLKSSFVEENNLDLSLSTTLVCEGKVHRDLDGSLSLDVYRVFSPDSNIFYKKVASEDPEKPEETWEEISVLEGVATFRVEGVVLRLVKGKNQLFLQIGEENNCKFFVPYSVLKNLNFAPRLGQNLRIEFEDTNTPLQIKSETQLFRISNWGE